MCTMASKCIGLLQIFATCKTATVNDARGQWFVYRKVVANVGIEKRKLNNRFIFNKLYSAMPSRKLIPLSCSVAHSRFSSCERCALRCKNRDEAQPHRVCEFFPFFFPAIRYFPDCNVRRY